MPFPVDLMKTNTPKGVTHIMTNTNHNKLGFKYMVIKMTNIAICDTVNAEYQFNILMNAVCLMLKAHENACKMLVILSSPV